MSSAELTDWMAYEQITGPLGGARDDLLMSVLAAVISNANRGKGRKARPSDFLPKWDRNKRMDWQDMLAAVRGINAQMGGTDTTKTGQEGGQRGNDPGRAPGAPRRRRRRADRRD
ncbi:hypothetical protein ACIP9H_29320 [Streptomyces sp. NPDC088732]|uniref:phage tail assembly protein T n=1 Tax=Streptomyces sp. NPDC088732 TaxID=3365879 RepID=UPI00380447B1